MIRSIISRPSTKFVFARTPIKYPAAGITPVFSSLLLEPLQNPPDRCYPFRQITISSVRASNSVNHAVLWKAERALSVALLGVLPVGLMFPSQTCDVLAAVSIVMHQHWGLEAILTDYVRPGLFGNVVPKLAHGVLLALSATTLGGLLYFIYNDIGIAGCIRKIWMIMPKESAEDKL